MGKNVVIIGGTPRAGKTTLSLMLGKQGYNIISFDRLSQALENGFPQCGIENWNDHEECAKAKFGFFEAIVNGAIDDGEFYGMKTVIDMYDFTPEYIERLKNKEKIDALFLCYSGQTKEEIAYNIRHYAKPFEWIAQVSEEYLQEVAQRCHDFNELIVRKCAEYRYRCFDMSCGARRGEALEEVAKFVMREDS